MDGEIKTLTVKSNYSKTFSGTAKLIDEQIALGKYAMFKMTYDKDGYVTNATVMDNTVADVYDWDVYNAHKEIKDTYKVYDVYFTKTPNRTAQPVAVGNTLYNKANTTNDVGLTIAAGAPIIVVQEEKDSDSNSFSRTINSYSSFAQALNTLEDANSSTDALDFNGHITALLNKNGTASYVVIKSDTLVGVTTDNGTTPTNGDLTIDTMTYSATAISATQGGFVIELSNEVAIADATEYTVTITNKDGAKLLSASGNISGNIAADAGVEIKVAYSAVLGTGSYVVNVTIGDMAASDVMLVA